MAYQTIRDIVEHVRSVHRRLCDAVREARSEADDERTALLLAVIDEHESTLERAVESAQQTGGSVLDTWLQFDPNAEVERAMRHRASDSPSSRDAIVAHVLETENSLMRLYELLRGSTSSPSVQSFFLSLLEIEDSAVRQSARVVLEAGDI
ncbi:MAG TPA: hypothetical protein VEK15_21040 [Vicinamibacteria bacterium]|nr:hypothetical protein [Vicinamibacteria bacterium]